MKFCLKFLSSVSTILLINSVTHIAISMDGEDLSKRESKKTIKVAEGGHKRSNIRPALEVQRVVPTKKAPPHPKELTHEQLRKIFLPKEGGKTEFKKEESLPVRKIELEAEIEGHNVTVYCSPKTFKDSEIRQLLTSCESTNSEFVAKFREYLIKKREDHTLAGVCNSASVPGYVLYYNNEVLTPVFERDTLIYIAFAAYAEDLPDVVEEISPSASVISASAAGDSESEESEGEKGKDKKDNESSSKNDPGSEDEKEGKKPSAEEEKEKHGDLKGKKGKKPTPIKPFLKFTHKNLLAIFDTSEAVVIDKKSQNRYKVVIEDNEKRGAILELLKRKGQNKYTASFKEYKGNSTISTTLTTQGQQKRLCVYQLQRKRTILKDAKAEAPAGFNIQKPEEFHTFTVSFYHAE